MVLWNNYTLVCLLGEKMDKKKDISDLFIAIFVFVVAVCDVWMIHVLPHAKYEFHIASMVWFWGVMNYIQGLRK